MESINLSLTVEQVKALLQISQNQLFRMKFLDPKMPGYKARPGEVWLPSLEKPDGRRPSPPFKP